MASDTYHEPIELLSDATRNMHRAVVSLIEELEAVDWYQQRADACSDPHLADILRHNRDEEIEHAAMVLEWLRRHTPQVDTMLRKYLFTEAPLTAIEEAAVGDAPATVPAASLEIGSLKGR